ncbi:hypothetical protein Cgig2_008842 [Carnegiea gigantea]|uniref:Lipoxygenase n=1 Tax=Carnegiea gigantea TaxID=171969 RepID=A0A9Q1GNN4_9CARY|nr:hypothetical protein Cgig2_008842 [Carnegiea gigantea]
MLNTSVSNINKTPSLLSLPKTFVAGSDQTHVHLCHAISPSAGAFFIRKHSVGKNLALTSRTRLARSGIRASAPITTDTEKSISVKAAVTVKPSVSGVLSNFGASRGLDDVADLLGKSILLELVSTEVNPETGSEKPTIKGYAHRGKIENGLLTYEAKFEVPPKFGEIGAVLVENEHHKEMHLAEIVLDGFPLGPVHFSCNSWVHSKFDNPEKRVFFSNKSYLPSETPSGLKKLRDRELDVVRGDGQGERKAFERIYDYDTYNDLADPDKDPALARPVLGGKDHPYPRRCRTGRPRTKTDERSESRSINIYVPRDEQFSEVKSATFSAKTLYSALHALIPSLETSIVDPKLGFPFFTAIDTLFHEGFSIPKQDQVKDLLPRLVKTVTDIEADVLRFERPYLFDRDRFSWFNDEEFSRQTLAGLNPLSIKLVTEWPLKSNLDPQVYGPPESAITRELVENEMRGFLTLDQVMKEKRLFIIDYHDAFLPYVNKVRELDGTTLYGSRTLFVLTKKGTLRPLAIELTRPPGNGKPQWKQVFTPYVDATNCWLWRLAKAHVLAHDSGYHQLLDLSKLSYFDEIAGIRGAKCRPLTLINQVKVGQSLRTHCCTEPYIIATNRQLSTMHPIYRLLHPHFRYTMEINALARGLLINANGIIESTFSPGKYSIELSSVMYDKQWRFDHEALPADLISRGLAVENASQPHGLELTIKDYPYANDGLVLWDSIKEWVQDYVNHYYSEPSLVESDVELQAWWEEIRTKGHADKKDEPWWPTLKTPQDLVQILTTIIWVASGHHAAVNFGQYAYAGPTDIKQTDQ